MQGEKEALLCNLLIVFPSSVHKEATVLSIVCKILYYMSKEFVTLHRFGKLKVFKYPGIQVNFLF